jgi:hypothetical protein
MPPNIRTDYAKIRALDQILANAIIFTHPATRKVAKGTTITAAPSGSGPLMKGDIWIAEQY